MTHLALRHLQPELSAPSAAKRLRVGTGQSVPAIAPDSSSALVVPSHTFGDTSLRKRPAAQFEAAGGPAPVALTMAQALQRARQTSTQVAHQVPDIIVDRGLHVDVNEYLAVPADILKENEALQLARPRIYEYR